MIADWLKYLQTPDPIWRPYAFDRVTISGRNESGEPVQFSLLGTCYSEYQSGPNLFHLANVAGRFFGDGYYGLYSCRELGFRATRTLRC
jgi:hypothetical protein